MTTPKIEKSKFWVIKPLPGKNFIKNPRFDKPDGSHDWTAYGSGVTIADYADGARYGAYCMAVNPTSSASGAYYAGLSVELGKSYTFSCDVKGTSGQAMRIYIANGSGTAKATTTFTATGYWQRRSVTWVATENMTNYRVYVVRDAISSTAQFFVDGVQFEESAEPTTLICGYDQGCRWEGLARNSNSVRSLSAFGGLPVDLDNYCFIESITGLGHGDWNQIMTKMTAGGDLYQNHIRKSRQFSLVVGISALDMSDLHRKRKELIDLLRPDAVQGQEMILRYQGFDENGNEATNPLDIRCVLMPGTLNDMPDIPTFQRVTLNFAIPSGLLDGAYSEGKRLDLFAQFPAEYIVKMDANGNWCKWTGAAYENLVKNITYSENGNVLCMAESPDGKVYVGGDFLSADGVANTARLARWNPVTEQWESVISGLNDQVACMAFDMAGNLYIGGSFTSVGGTSVNLIAKLTNLSGTASVEVLGSGLDYDPKTIVIGNEGEVFVGGTFLNAGGVTGTSHVAKWNPSTSSWSALANGLSSAVNDMAIAPNGNLWLAGMFQKADGVNGNHLCFWDGTSFHPYWKPALSTGTELNTALMSIAFDEAGKLYIGGFLQNYIYPFTKGIACWNGTQWDLMGGGLDGVVDHIKAKNGKIYVSGWFKRVAGASANNDNIQVWANSTWMPFDIDLPGQSQSLQAMLFAKDDSLYFGGLFSTTKSGENVKTGIVALNLNVASASANTHPFIQVHGAGTLKAIRNYTTGKVIMFDGLTLQSGEWINFSFDPLNLQFVGGWPGRGNLMRYILPGSDYGDFFLKPGANNLSIFMTDTDTNSGAWIEWKPKFWGLDGAVLS